MARIEVVRHVAADPSGLALLLSGPTGRELWPDGELVLGPPQRSGVGFRVDCQLAGPPLARGRLLISGGHDGPAGSEVRLTLTVPAMEVGEVRAAAEEFLDGLVAVAQARSTAA